MVVCVFLLLSKRQRLSHNLWIEAEVQPGVNGGHFWSFLWCKQLFVIPFVLWGRGLGRDSEAKELHEMRRGGLGLQKIGQQPLLGAKKGPGSLVGLIGGNPVSQLPVGDGKSKL